MRKVDPFLARLFNLVPFRPWRIKILGLEVAGDVVEVGSQMNRLQVGDLVISSCGLLFERYAEFTFLPAKGMVVAKMDNPTYREAPAVPAGGCSSPNRELVAPLGRRSDRFFRWSPPPGHAFNNIVFDAIPAAHRYMEHLRKKSNLVITIE